MSLFDKYVSKAFRHGTLTIIDHKGVARNFGVPTTGFPDVAVRFADGRVARDIALAPDVGAGEAYMDGRLIMEKGDVLDLVSLLRMNNPWDKGGNSGNPNIWRDSLRKAKGRVDRINWARRSKRNVAHHYDLSDRLYDLFLDADRQYSCAYFTDPGNTLEQAQADKKAHIAAKLALAPGQRVLDIGCGWGGMALYLNRVADVDVLGITLSEEQLKVARQRAEASGVADRVRFELIDYRDVTGPFDRIVSVGMFEHVGPRHYEAFFRKCRDLLTDDGVMLLHTIGRLGEPGVTDAWTAKYIFPGGYSPALSEIVSASERTRLLATDIETLRLHYGLTLQHWYNRVVEKRAEIEALYDERFYRMWQFYLAGATAAFENGSLCNYQLQYSRRRRTLPITRDYIRDEEERLRTLSVT
ncbi:cyclopropane-fatty-acyl-phospholipid synthase family protein [Sphingomonas sp.]|uniref:SAM-dependent methyltransferase n=1 Tax=Sphingomonas sp. TaxID=28214 RepID=UPI0025E6A14E|nr:cyclopropane-fatty-acyl-phospholipid synthase family protein [Sphingomonas sp.]